MITETDDIAAVLDRAAIVWPELAKSRAELLKRVVQHTFESVDALAMTRVDERRQRILANAGKFPGVWPDDWRDGFRAEWPE